jgi:(1->4)-alpha-D-glucan 1-alpha-D-glucosylmutase
VLAHRRRHRARFDSGDYVPLTAEGTRARNVVAFARGNQGSGKDGASIVVIGRFLTGLSAATQPPIGEAWGDTRLALPQAIASAELRDVISGTTVATEQSRIGELSIRLNHLFSHLPVALLEQHS